MGLRAMGNTAIPRISAMGRLAHLLFDLSETLAVKDVFAVLALKLAGSASFLAVRICAVLHWRWLHAALRRLGVAARSWSWGQDLAASRIRL